MFIEIYNRLTAEEMEAVKAGRIKEREKRWNNLFSVSFTIDFTGICHRIYKLKRELSIQFDQIGF